MITAYQLTSGWYSPRVTAGLVLGEAVPVEDLVDPSVASTPVWDMNLGEITDPRLRDFLVRPQGGSREIARRIFRRVAEHRRGQFSAASAELLPVPGAPIFADVPEDTGHFPGPYYRHVLQGLRTSPPAYVQSLRRAPTLEELWESYPSMDGYIGRMTAASGPLSKRRPPPELQETTVAGVVLVTI